jgi:hypothetical protein
MAIQFPSALARDLAALVERTGKSRTDPAQDRRRNASARDGRATRQMTTNACAAAILRH